MTDKEYAKQKKRIRQLIAKWHGTGFGWWRIDYEYDREVKESDNEVIRNCVADCSTSWEYRTALITFYMPVVARQSDEELENQFVHEHAHILIGAIQDFSNENARQMTEYATECVARALVWAREAGAKDKK